MRTSKLYLYMRESESERGDDQIVPFESCDRRWLLRLALQSSRPERSGTFWNHGVACVTSPSCCTPLPCANPLGPGHYRFCPEEGTAVLFPLERHQYTGITEPVSFTTLVFADQLSGHVRIINYFKRWSRGWFSNLCKGHSIHPKQCCAVLCCMLRIDHGLDHASMFMCITH